MNNSQEKRFILFALMKKLIHHKNNAYLKYSLIPLFSHLIGKDPHV